MARVVVVDVRESLEILFERLCYGLQVFCFLDAINPEAFVLFCCEESNVAWSHKVMVEDDWFICHCLGGVRLVVRMLAFYCHLLLVGEYACFMFVQFFGTDLLVTFDA